MCKKKSSIERWKESEKDGGKREKQKLEWKSRELRGVSGVEYKKKTNRGNGKRRGDKKCFFKDYILFAKQKR